MSAMGDGRLSRNGSDYLDGNRQTSSRGRPDLLFSSACIRAWLSRFEPGEQHQIVRHHGGPDVGLEVVQSAPGATGGAVRAFEAGDRRLDAGAKVAQTTVDPRALDHLDNGDAALLVEGDVGNAAGLGGGEIGAADVASAAVCRGGAPVRAIWRSSIETKRSASAGLPVSMTTSRISPLLPVVRLSLCPY